MNENQKYIRKCPNCNKEIQYLSLKSLKHAIRDNTTCRTCIKMPDSLKNTLSVYWTGKKNPKRKDLPKNFKRICPDCKTELFYVKKWSYVQAIKNNSKCRKCCMEHPIKANEMSNFKRECPKCKKELYYSTLYSLRSAMRKKSLCINCKKIKDETKKKHRLSMIKHLNKIKELNCQIVPNFNPDACKIIDEYGKKNGYNFQHAMNGGEFHIKELGYWVDGYDKDKNTVLEIDEKKHFNANGKLRKKDIERQTEIENLLTCKFIRLKIGE